MRMKGFGKKGVAIFFATALVLQSCAFTVSTNDVWASEKKQQSVTKSEQTTNKFTSEKLRSGYTSKKESYTASPYEGEEISYSMSEIFSQEKGEDGATLVSDTKGYEGADEVLQLERTYGAKLVFDVPETALYYICFDYCSYDETVLPATMGLKLNGEYPFYEARNLSFESNWKDVEEVNYDRYGNQIVSMPEKEISWQSKYVMDSSYRYTMPLMVSLEKGKNTIELELSEGNLLLGSMKLVRPFEVPAYEGAREANGDQLIEIQAEDFYGRNDSSIRGTCEYDVNLSPYNVKNKVLNTINGDSFTDAGQTVTWQVNVEEAGDYYIAMNYCQDDKNDFPVFADIAVDNTIVNEAFKDYAFPYVKDFTMMKLLGSDNNYLSVYLEKGTHTISLTLSAEPLRELFEKIEEVMNNINDLSLEVTRVAGTNKDRYRDFDLEAYIPDLGEKLKLWAKELDEMVETMSVYNPDVKEIGALSSIGIASNQLRSLAKKPNELIYRMAELATSTNSANQYLANEIDTLNKNNLSIDRVWLFQKDSEKELPKKAGFLRSAMSQVSRFATSFMEQAYSTTNGDKEHLKVWVNRSRQYLEVMQKLIDEKFTPETGIEVDLSLMPDQNKLILANASGDSPDIATGLNYAQPFELGIRGALKDLTEFEDYKDVLSQFEEGLLVPATIKDGIYAIPETMNFWVLFYREDILEKLGIEVPDTLEEVKNILPELQMRGMNFYYPTAGMIAMKNFHGTTPLLFQNGANLYGDSILNNAITSEESVEGFKELTDLFTIYNLPKDIPSFYQHFRNGDLPIGIADITTYNQLLNAAPEIENSWKIAKVPGTVDEESGEVVRYQCAGAEDIVMFESNEEREAKAWEFMKWWTSAEIQAEYGQMMQISYGDEYMWNTANTEAFQMLPWKSDDKEVILEQAEWIVEAPRVPGSYMVERELSNAYNSIVVDGKTLRTTLDDAAKNIDRETERKLEEFGYLKDGEVVTEYETPTIETVRKILGKDN